MVEIWQAWSARQGYWPSQSTGSCKRQCAIVSLIGNSSVLLCAGLTVPVYLFAVAESSVQNSTEIIWNLDVFLLLVVTLSLILLCFCLCILQCLKTVCTSMYNFWTAMLCNVLVSSNDSLSMYVCVCVCVNFAWNSRTHKCFAWNEQRKYPGSCEMLSRRFRLVYHWWLHWLAVVLGHFWHKLSKVSNPPS